jgi:transposase
MFFNKINLTKDDDVYIGIDAHKDSYNIGIWLNDAPDIDCTMPANNKKLIKDIEKIRPAIKNIVYEAGPTGYTLARELQNQDLPVQVIAPAITPRPATKQTKTDLLLYKVSGTSGKLFRAWRFAL